MQARQFARDALARHPGLKTNRLYYEIERSRAYREVALRPQLTDRPEVLAELDERGVVVIPNYLDSERVGALAAIAEQVIADADAGRLGDHVFRPESGAFFRVGQVDAVAPGLGAYFGDATLNGVVSAYMSPRATSHRHELDYRFGISAAAQADLYHFDNWRPICKAFLYLVDISEDNAPFVYVPGTHRQDRWRIRHNMQYDGGKFGRFGYLLPQEMRGLRSRFGWEDQVCTGPAGTLILADLRGLHRGTPLRAGRRLMLTNVWDLMNAGAL